MRVQAPIEMKIELPTGSAGPRRMPQPSVRACCELPGARGLGAELVFLALTITWRTCRPHYWPAGWRKTRCLLLVRPGLRMPPARLRSPVRRRPPSASVQVNPIVHQVLGRQGVAIGLERDSEFVSRAGVRVDRQ